MSLLQIFDKKWWKTFLILILAGYNHIEIKNPFFKGVLSHCVQVTANSHLQYVLLLLPGKTSVVNIIILLLLTTLTSRFVLQRLAGEKKR